MNIPANTPDASAEALAAHFQVAELEPRLENDWLDLSGTSGGGCDAGEGAHK